MTNKTKIIIDDNILEVEDCIVSVSSKSVTIRKPFVRNSNGVSVSSSILHAFKNKEVYNGTGLPLNKEGKIIVETNETKATITVKEGNCKSIRVTKISK